MPEHFIIRRDTEAIVQGIGDDAHLFSGKTVLLSGGAGFLGKHFLRVFKRLNDTILEQPVRVISVDNFITGDPSTTERDENIVEVWADVTYPLPVREDIHYIMHAAGLASPVYYMKYPLETIESAVSGIKNLLELGRRNPELAGFLFFSSSEIYGDPDPRFVPTPETYHGHVSSVGPRACYDESKRLAETIATIYHQKYGLPVTIVRPFNVFGPGMKHDDRRVVPMFTYRALTGEPIPLHGDGTADPNVLLYDGRDHRVLEGAAEGSPRRTLQHWQRHQRNLDAQSGRVVRKCSRARHFSTSTTPTPTRRASPSDAVRISPKPVTN